MSEDKKPREITLQHVGEMHIGNKVYDDHYRAVVSVDPRPRQDFITKQPDIICVEKSAYDKAIEALKEAQKERDDYRVKAERLLGYSFEQGVKLHDAAVKALKLSKSIMLRNSMFPGDIAKFNELVKELGV